MKKGEIWFVEIPSSNGREQAGLRPVMIIAESEANISVIIPLTSNTFALRFSPSLQISPSKSNGLSKSSVALIFQVRAIDKKRLKRKIGILNKENIQEIDKKLKSFLEL